MTHFSQFQSVRLKSKEFIDNRKMGENNTKQVAIDKILFRDVQPTIAFHNVQICLKDNV